MGTLTIGKKRSHDFLNCKLPASSSPSFDSYPLKKTKFFTSSNQAHDCPRPEPMSLITRFRQYPGKKPPFKREPLAPVRQSRFGRSLNSNSSRSSNLLSRNRVNLPSGMGNLLITRLEQARETLIKPFRHAERKDGVFENKEYEVFEFNDDEVVEVVKVEGKEPSGDSVTVEDERNRVWNWKGSVEDVLELKTPDGKVVNGHFQPSSPSAVTNVSNGSLRVLSEVRMLESGNMGLNAYKNLLSDVQRKYQHLEPLQFQIDFTEKKRQAQQQSRPPKKVQVDVEAEAMVDAFRKEMVSEAFKPLTQDEENQVARAFSNSQRRKLLIAHESSNIDITGELLHCLRPGMWLNDEVINLYLELLKEREKREPQKFLKCHYFNTFFYKKLISGKDGYNFQSVKRWTSQRKLGYCIFDCDKIFVPIHKNIHWCLAIINKKEQKFQYLDSLGGADSHVLKVLARYFVDEVKEKSGKEIDVSSWTQENVEDLPEQKNGFDCGVFMIKYADFYGRGIGLCFQQDHMPYFRKRTAKEILNLKAE